MKKYLWCLVVISCSTFFFIAPQIINAHIVIEGTDRVLVEKTNEEGDRVVESVLWDEVIEEKTYEEGEMTTASNGERVLILEPDYLRSIHVTEQQDVLTPWAINRIGVLPMKNELTNIRNEFIVGVIDSGVDVTHPFLRGRILPGYNVLTETTDVADAQSHGTHVTGIIVDTATANIKVLPIAAIGKDGKGYDSNIAKGIYAAVDRGAKVINLSVGGKNFSRYLSQAIDYAVARNVLIVASAGNEGDNIANYYPASDERVVTVTATDQLNTIARFNNTGETVDLAAPGVAINSAIPGGKYGRMSGTSMAAPYVTAVAAMIANENPYYSIQDVEKVLKMYVKDLGAPGWDRLYGEGLLNVSQFTKKDRSARVIIFPEKSNVPIDKKWTITLDKPILNTTPIEVTLFDGKERHPVTIVKNGIDKKLTIIPVEPYVKDKDYLLEVIINEKKYSLKFKTTNS